MRGYLLGRLLKTLPTMFIVVTGLFFALRLGPVDPAQTILGDYASAEAIRSLHAELGLDRPLIVQYLSFLKNLARGDFGVSLINGMPVIKQIGEIFPYTLDLVFGGMLIGILLGIPLGIYAATRLGRPADYIGRIISLIGISMPEFVLGIMLLILFSLVLKLFPVMGGGNLAHLGERLHHLFLPALAQGLILAAFVMRLTRSSILEVLGEDYIRTARSKGLSKTVVLFKHALRNALIPVVTVVGIIATITLGSTILVEIVFTRPGIGRLIIEAVIAGDFPIVQSVLMLYAGSVVLINLAVDISYAFLDPRIRKK